ncbi:hypothetical protein BYT27DRAFT_7210515 [Phlegmacium glaucopus]|nr:hypothetical protein BYT27DRAFT_7210515 [Phlegmacium glaucopus]
MAADKSLFNMQLAITHISFMLQHKSEDIHIPDFPGTLQKFKDIAALMLSDSEAPIMDKKKNLFFLEKLACDKQNIDNLHLPFQKYKFIFPPFMSNDTKLHCIQKHLFIWKELFSVAKGQQTIEDAAANIVEFIPDHLNDIGSDIRNWFLLKPSGIQNDAVHMSIYPPFTI